MKKYTRVSYGVRCQIYALMQAKISIPEIASQLGFNKSTIYRELKRNSPSVGDYRPQLAQKKSSRRYANCRKCYAVDSDLKEKLEDFLLLGWSPEQISGRFKEEKISKVSHQTLYNFINKDINLRVFLRRFYKRGAGRYKQRSRFKREINGFRIKDRPWQANERSRIGDWERDTMHTQDGVQVLVCVDRKSRLTKIERVKTRTSYEIGNQTIKMIEETGRKALTLTNDNGGDFKGKSDIDVPIYFCRPLRPQERGTVENTIGLLRQYISRKTNVRGYEKDDFLHLENLMNYRPRKVLGYKTPHEVYYREKVALGSLI